VFFITFSLTFYGKNLFLHVRTYQFFWAFKKIP
jgi:hypothetical protein